MPRRPESPYEIYVTKFAVWLDASWRREHLPEIDPLTSAVLARPAPKEV